MHAISSYRGNTPTNKEIHTNAQTGPITIHCAAASLARSVIKASPIRELGGFVGRRTLIFLPNNGDVSCDGGTLSQSLKHP